MRTFFLTYCKDSQQHPHSDDGFEPTSSSLPKGSISLFAKLWPKRKGPGIFPVSTSVFNVFRMLLNVIQSLKIAPILRKCLVSALNLFCRQGLTEHPKVDMGLGGAGEDCRPGFFTPLSHFLHAHSVRAFSHEAVCDKRACHTPSAPLGPL